MTAVSSRLKEPYAKIFHRQCKWHIRGTESNCHSYADNMLIGIPAAVTQTDLLQLTECIRHLDRLMVTKRLKLLGVETDDFAWQSAAVSELIVTRRRVHGPSQNINGPGRAGPRN